MYSKFIQCVLSAFFTFTIFSTQAEPLPVKYFASLPDVTQVELAPDGKHVAALVRVDGEMEGTALRIFNLETLKSDIVLYATNEKFVVQWIEWANHDQVLVSAVFPSTRQGTPVTETRLLIVDIETKKTRGAIPKSYYSRFNFMPQYQDRIIDMLPDDPDHFLLQIRGFSNDPTILKISTRKKKVKRVLGSEKNVYRWRTDRQHNPRIGIYRKDTHYKIIHKSKRKESWKTLWEFDSFAADQVWPKGFDTDPNILYVSALHEGRDAIFKVNVNDPSLEKTLVYSHDTYDVDGRLFYSHLKKTVVGINTPDGYQFWDESYKALYKALNKVLPDADNYLISLSDDEQQYVVLSTSSKDSGTYFVGDRKKKTLSPIAYRYSKLPPEKMADKRWINYEARDGLAIEAALTLPIDYKEEQKLPTIIFPHGGPISHDGGGFDYWTQFFANRGYAVLQMNFRGSSGYGHDFMKAGLKSWGLAMQDDVEDGTRWMIEQGYADPEKICIVGASYGGYAALMGTVRTPDLYQCAVSFAGVTDVAYLVKSHRKYTNYKVVKEQIGSDFKALKKRSPLHNVENMKVPTLLIHGTKDRSVKVQHSRKLHKRMLKAGKQVEYIELDKGNHYLSKNEHRIATFEAMDRFLSEHLSH